MTFEILFRSLSKLHIFLMSNSLFQTVGTKLCFWFQVRPLRNGANPPVGCQSKAKTVSRRHCHCRNTLFVHAFICRILLSNLIEQLIWTVVLLYGIIFVDISTFLELFISLEHTLRLLIQNGVIPPLKV